MSELKKIVFIGHPSYMTSQSMPRFMSMLVESTRAYGFSIESLNANTGFSLWLRRMGFFNKWWGYFDEFVLFPIKLKRKLLLSDKSTIFVLCDQALGPLVPYIRKYPHIVHCHDLLALKSSLGIYKQNPTSLTGRAYQKYIRSGFRKGKNFICISEQTRQDMIAYGGVQPRYMGVVHNGLNYPFKAFSAHEAEYLLRQDNMKFMPNEYFLHVGGGQWYKNRDGVLELFGEYVRKCLTAKRRPLGLVLVGPQPNEMLKKIENDYLLTPYVQWKTSVSGEGLNALYSGAKALVFPSLAEGFGWPIIEAQACGCPVITTNSAPMNEIGGEHTVYIDNLLDTSRDQWLESASVALVEMQSRSTEEINTIKSKSVEWATKFTNDSAVNKIVDIYKKVFASEVSS